MNTLQCSSVSYPNKVARFIWGIVWRLLYRPSPIPFHFWRRFLLRIFGAKVARDCHPYPSARIWAPWNLVMEERSCLSHFVDCYCVDKVYLGRNVTISQYSFLCTASHDFRRVRMPLLTAPIIIDENVWVAADVFIGPGVKIGKNAVIGARSSVFKDVRCNVVVAGSPLKEIGQR